MKNPITTYIVRARIPKRIVQNLDLIVIAKRLGVNLSPDNEGNVEACWDADLITLDHVLASLRDIGLTNFMIQKSVISITATVPIQKSTIVRNVIQALKPGRLGQITDVFSGNTVFSCLVSCDSSVEAYQKLTAIAGCRVIGVEAFEVVTEGMP